MRVILEIPEDTLEKLGELAKLQKRSRKNFMEYILVNHTECAEYIASESISYVLSQNKPVEGNVRETDDVPNLGRKKKPGVKIQDLTNQSKTNYSIDTTVKPERMPEESGIDYSIRLAEWKQSLLNR